MTYITTTADNIILGKIGGASILGPYIIAYTVANIPVVIVIGVMSSVMVPAYAELNRRDSANLKPAHLKEVLKRVFSVSSVLLVSFLLPMFLIAQDVISLLYGPKWDAVIPVLQILTLVGLFRGLAHILASVSLGLNKPKIEAIAKSIEAIVFLAALFPLVLRYGAKGAAWAGVLSYIIAFLLRVWFIQRLIPQSVGEIAKILFVLFLATCAGGVAGQLSLTHLEGAFPRIIIGSLASALAMIIIMITLRIDLRREARAAVDMLWVKICQLRAARAA